MYPPPPHSPAAVAAAAAAASAGEEVVPQGLVDFSCKIEVLCTHHRPTHLLLLLLLLVGRRWFLRVLLILHANLESFVFTTAPLTCCCFCWGGGSSGLPHSSPELSPHPTLPHSSAVAAAATATAAAAADDPREGRPVYAHGRAVI